MRIEMIGPPGAGKTTLLKYIRTQYKNCKFENVEEAPLLSKFYADRPRFALIVEMDFVTKYFTDLIGFSGIYDSSIWLSYAYGDLNLSGREKAIFRGYFDYIIENIGMPSLLIYLTCHPEVARDRIIQRGRKYEENFDMEYWINVDRKISEIIGRTPSQVITIDNSHLQVIDQFIKVDIAISRIISNQIQ